LERTRRKRSGIINAHRGAPLNITLAVDLGCPRHFPARRSKMLFMVIERFRDNDMVPVYERVRDSGRMLPDGLKYIESWIEPNFSRCFQLMECDDPRLLQEWVLRWRGSGTTFEFFPVVTSAQTREVVAPHLTQPS
jgi:hypothetical protein